LIVVAFAEVVFPAAEAARSRTTVERLAGLAVTRRNAIVLNDPPLQKSVTRQRIP
jgi:hypothetical protein